MENQLANPVFVKLLNMAILILVALLARFFTVRWVKKNPRLRSTHKRQWIVRIRNITLFIIIGIGIAVWIEQLRTVAASIVVIAAAIVIATKEFILNLVGFAYRSAAKFVAVGDRIEVDGIRGDVIDQNLMGIILLEIGPGDKTHQYTGLTIFLPNSLFLSASVKNETFAQSEFVFHLMTIPIEANRNWSADEQELLKAAREVSAPYIEQARKMMTRLARQQSLEEPNIEPRVQIQIAEPDEYHLVLRVVVPARKRAKLEQEITRKYLEYRTASRSALPDESV